MNRTLTNTLTSRPHPLWRMLHGLAVLYTRAMLAIEIWARQPVVTPFVAGFITLGLLSTAGVYALSPWIELIVNRSDSLPQTLFLLDKTRAPQCGDYTAFDMPITARFYRGSRMIKRIAGCEGDTVSTDDQVVLINGHPVGHAMKRTSNGQYALQRIDPIIIPAGKVYLSATHPKSYDSRYASFGLRDTQELFGTALPLF